jgi:hypothetical protein
LSFWRGSKLAHQDLFIAHGFLLQIRALLIKDWFIDIRMTSSSSSLRAVRRGWFRCPTCLFCSRSCLTLLPLLRTRHQAHYYPARMATREGSFSASTPAHVLAAEGAWRGHTCSLRMSLSRFTCTCEGTLAPRQCQSCKHRSLVVLDATGYRLQLGQVARFSRTQPAVQLLSRLLPDHLHDPLCQSVSGRCAWTSLPDQCQFRLLPLVQLLWLTHKQKGWHAAQRSFPAVQVTRGCSCALVVRAGDDLDERT